MNLDRYLLLPEGRLRAGWRLLLFAIFFLGSLVVFNGLAFAFLRQQDTPSPMVFLAATRAAGLATVCLATWLMMHLFEHQPFQSVGLARPRESLGEMTLGMAGGVTLVGTVGGVEWAMGAIHFQPTGTAAASALLLLLAATGVILVAVGFEELLFRGYPFQRLLEGSNAYVAVALTSLIFGLLHARNPHATSLSTLNTMLAGILLSLAYVKTRALWLPLSFHFSWNWTLALLGLPVSGIELAEMPWQALASSSHIWLHGGEYGPEGGLVATAALMVGIAYLLRKKSKSR